VAPQHAAISIFGHDGTIRYSSPELANLLGYLPEETAGKTFRTFVPRSYYRYLVHEWSRLVVPGSPGGDVYVMTRSRDGSLIPLVLTVCPIPGRDESFVTYHGLNASDEQLNAMNTVLTALNKTLKLSQVLDVILEQISRVIPAKNSSVTLIKGNRVQLFRPLILIGTELEMNNPAAWLAFQSIQQVRQTLRPVIINDTHNDPRWKKLSMSDHIRSWMGIPLIQDGECCGILQVYTTVQTLIRFQMPVLGRPSRSKRRWRSIMRARITQHGCAPPG
jgi:PAS domain S-box-containing protein